VSGEILKGLGITGPTGGTGGTGGTGATAVTGETIMIRNSSYILENLIRESLTVLSIKMCVIKTYMCRVVYYSMEITNHIILIKKYISIETKDNVVVAKVFLYPEEHVLHENIFIEKKLQTSLI
jgi:hypothetical protein